MRKYARDDKAARKARAESLRERITQLKSGGFSKDSEPKDKNRPNEELPAGIPRHESPRQFIERRMRELDKQRKKKMGRS